MKVLVFGTGELYRKYKAYFNDMHIIGLIDNDKNKWGKILDGYEILSPSSINGLEYDYIFLVSAYYLQMREQLINLGINEDKIIDAEHKGLFRKLTHTENYIFNHNFKSPQILLISHALELTGAPIAFCRLAHVLKRNGYNVTVYSTKYSNGNYAHLLYDLLQDEISVVLYDDLNDIDVSEVDKNYELVWVNTITLAHVVALLIPTGRKICWWLHEADDAYKNFDSDIDYSKASNLNVFSVGEIAREAYERHSGHCINKNLLYGLENEYINQVKMSCNLRLRFGLIGTYCKRKGQDILVEAILKHPDWREKAEFILVGKVPNDFKAKIVGIDNIECVGEITPKEVSKLYETLDVVICPSIYDPMPIVVSEAMQHKKVCIVSNNVGQFRYIKDGVNGLVCIAGSAKSLSEKIDWAIKNRDSLSQMGELSYKIFRDNFEFEKFEQNVLDIMSKLLNERGRNS